jgi:hypothetical protein
MNNAFFARFKLKNNFFTYIIEINTIMFFYKNYLKSVFLVEVMLSNFYLLLLGFIFSNWFVVFSALWKFFIFPQWDIDFALLMTLFLRGYFMILKHLIKPIEIASKALRRKRDRCQTCLWIFMMRLVLMRNIQETILEHERFIVEKQDLVYLLSWFKKRLQDSLSH